MLLCFALNNLDDFQKEVPIKVHASLTPKVVTYL